MKFNTFFLFIFALLPSCLWAQWQTVGRADYNWGPFLVYTMTLDTEDGQYQDEQRPVMLSFDYAKPIEGKNFSIILMKEMVNLGEDQEKAVQWLEELENTLPDFSPNDHLSYVALPEQGYFILNHEVLDHVFSPEFNQAFLSIWLAEKSKFTQLRKGLLGKEKVKVSETRPKPVENSELGEEDASPQLPPNYKLTDQKRAFS